MKFSALLASIGLLPKNPEEAKATREAAAATLARANDMFASAGLNLEQMLEAGPDALKAHLASLDQADAIKALEGKVSAAEASVTDLTGKLSAAETDHGVTKEALKTHADLLAATGFKAEPTAKADDVKKAFNAHVEKAAALVLAKDGRPPIAHANSDGFVIVTCEANLTDEQHLAAWEAMQPGDARTAYSAKHHEAILRADRARSHKAIPRS